MRQVVLWDTACNFNAFISNQSILNRLITGASTLFDVLHFLFCVRNLSIDAPEMQKWVDFVFASINVLHFCIECVHLNLIRL